MSNQRASGPPSRCSPRTPTVRGPSPACSPRCAASYAPATLGGLWWTPRARSSLPSSPAPPAPGPPVATGSRTPPSRTCSKRPGRAGLGLKPGTVTPREPPRSWGRRGRGARSGSRALPLGRRPSAHPLGGGTTRADDPHETPPVRPTARLTSVPKTLVIAEKPSVGRDLARVLPGTFKKEEGWLEAEEYIITWAVGHLVQLAEPDEYDPKFKRWKMEDLPIVPDRFKLVVRDERSRKQMSVVAKQLTREDVGDVVNACDAGREGELIFAYIYEKAGSDKPVQRLWLNSMTNAAMKEAFASLRPASEYALLEQAARSRSESDWIVGMNATRAATIRLRTSFDGAVSLGRVQTPTLAIVVRREEEIRAFVPEPYWLVDATLEADGKRRYEGRYHAAAS